MNDPRRTSRSHDVDSTHRYLPYALGAGLLVLLMWPLQTILAVLVAGAAFALADELDPWIQGRGNVASAHAGMWARRISLLAAVVSIVLIWISPTGMLFAALTLAVLGVATAGALHHTAVTSSDRRATRVEVLPHSVERRDVASDMRRRAA
jgi:hypothetical protein